MNPLVEKVDPMDFLRSREKTSRFLRLICIIFSFIKIGLPPVGIE